MESDDGEPPQERESAEALRLELARSQSRRFGKLRPHASGYFTPAAAGGFHDHRDERNPLSSTLRFGVKVTAFEILIAREDGVGIVDGQRQRVQPRSASDREIPGSWWA